MAQLFQNPYVMEGYREGVWRDHETGKYYITLSEGRATMLSNVLAVALSLVLSWLFVYVKLAAKSLDHWIQRRGQGSGLLRYRDEQEHQQEGQEEQLLSLQDDPASIELSVLPPSHGQHQNSVPQHASERVGQIIAQGTSEQNTAAALFKEWRFVVLSPRCHLPPETPGFLSRLSQRIKDIKQNVRDAHWTTVILTFLFTAFCCLFIAWQAIAISTGKIIGTSLVRTTHPQAGAWFPEVLDPFHMSNMSIVTAVNDLYTLMAVKSVAYEESCYSGKGREEECSLFHSTKLNFTEHRNATCPFKDDMCLHGAKSAYELETGFLDAKLLGINFRDTCRFRIRKVCSPVVADERYVKLHEIDNSGNRKVEYHYGDGWGIMQDGDKTFEETVHKTGSVPEGPADYVIREIKGETLQLPGSKSPRQWRQELYVDHSRVTLYFVRPVNLQYTRQSHDPIFPATVVSSRMQYGDLLYASPFQRSTILGCADSIEIQDPVSSDVWYPRYQNMSQLMSKGWQNPSVLASLRIINASYLTPEYFESRYSTPVEHFDARKRILNFYSSPLSEDPPQWQLESRKIFQTQLASMQYRTIAIGQGIGHDLPKARNLLADSIAGQAAINARGIILRPVPGYKNIKFAEFMGFVSLIAGVTIITVEIRVSTRIDGRPVTKPILLPILVAKSSIVWWKTKGRPYLVELRDDASQLDLNRLVQKFDAVADKLKLK
ncbi:hypothetical protein BDV96DRAFT_596512 [Lophiotrema nucula]|uniref:Uncharacterized protein n=1 Tax=Lophiotrema nucula TaxID=690887 RepID=A0A6A5ZGP2_9PLEO|nr:hypothetical protein BDV96DRAFT_596512 [Lophiotrema nucula]